MHNVIQFNQKACLKQYIDINTKLRTETKNRFEKDFFYANGKCSFLEKLKKRKKSQRY